MTDKFKNVSMNGRMAYTIMCVESYLAEKFPNKDWTLICKILWQATSSNWGDWSDIYSSVIPDVIFQYEEYSNEDYEGILSEEEFQNVKNLFSGITEGIENDPGDEVNYMLNKPFEMAMVYEGTVIGDGKESFNIIENAENILKKNGIALPDYKKVLFSSADEHNGWGNDFDGEYLSIILNKEQK